MPRFVSGLIDVFADESLAGNPLAVVEEADALSENVLRRIAGEFNQTETTFLMKSDRADWKLRSFTANGSEIYGAGHNALGAWLWLGYYGRLGSLRTPTTFQQEIGTDILPITLEMRDGRMHGQMRQGQLKLSAPLTGFAPLAAALRLSGDDVIAEPAPRVADTGAGHLVVRLRSSEAVDRVRPGAEALLAVLASAGAEGCYVYAFNAATPRAAYARFFNPTVGLWEDSATGTAAGPLCAYLGTQGLLDEDATLVVEQGVLMGRRSLLHVRLSPEPELSGTGVVVLSGLLEI